MQQHDTLKNLVVDKDCLKPDFSNAFNSSSRDILLQTVVTELPELYKKAVLLQGNRAMPQLFFSV